MRKFIIAAVLLAVLPTGNMQACLSEGPTHNKYMFSVFRRDAMDGPAYLADINQYWIDYCKGRIAADDYDRTGYTFYNNHRSEVLKVAQAKGDQAMAAYLKLLNRYIDVCDLFTVDRWSYPTKEQLATRKQKALAILNAAKAYRGTQLRQQYTLLQMRANMILGYDLANANLWNQQVKRFGKSCWREAMQNIYARTLYKSGKRLEACDQYALTNDMNSIKRVMGNYRNLAGIKSVYAQNPNSPALNYLVQDFVNNVQETLDQKPKNSDDCEWLNEIDAKCIFRNEALAFVEFAKTVAKQGKSATPCLWWTAAGMTDYLLGNQQQAMEETEQALNAAGTQRMSDNARAIRLLVTTRSARLDDAYTTYLLGEMRWLDGMIKAERSTMAYDNHYTDVKDRVVHKGLEPLFAKAGRPYMALALCDMMRQEESAYYAMAYKREEQKGYSKYQYMRHSPWDEVFCQMDSMKTDQLVGYYRFVTSTPNNALERYTVARAFKDDQYFNDLIGTKYMAEGAFAKAIPYLEKLSTEFMSNQPISIYEAQTNYDVVRWFKRQPIHYNSNEYYSPDNEYHEVTTNKKLEFCKEMMRLQSQYALTRQGQPLEELSYQLAVRYFQASCYGDCWWITHHYKSVSDSARSWELDYAKQAIEHLNLCKHSQDEQMRYRTLYALAFVNAYIPGNSWISITYDKDWNEVMNYRPESAQYKALAELNDYATNYPERIDEYARRCDVLQRFQAMNHQP